MPFNTSRIRRYLKAFESLFIEELGWDYLDIRPQHVPIGDNTFRLAPVAQKKGVQIFTCGTDGDGRIPDYATRQKIDRQVTKWAREHVIIFVDNQQTTQIWQWVKRQQGKPTAYREHAFHTHQSGEAPIQKLRTIAFMLEEEEFLLLSDVTYRLEDALDKEQVTKKFYQEFGKERKAFLKALKGVELEDDREWYTSVMLNRLMFVYFIQKKGFLDGDVGYLRNRLKTCRQEFGDDRFYSFYRTFLLRLFHDGLACKEDRRDAEVNRLIGDIPYLNGGIFQPHELERTYDALDIPDEAFARVFDFFDDYQWHLDYRPLQDDREINPDVLGYIFEQYINQKQMGAYYTKEDITGYISRNTILPFLFDEARKGCKEAFEGDQSVWNLLRDDPDRYIYPAVRHGIYDDEGNRRDLHLFQSFIQYVNTRRHGIPDFAKISTDLEASILRKVIKHKPVSYFEQDRGSNIYYHNAPVHWGKVFDFVPHFKKGNHPPEQFSHVKDLSFSNTENAAAVICLLNSSFFHFKYRIGLGNVEEEDFEEAAA